MDFENLFSKPPNPALGKTAAADSDERIDDEIDDTEVEETQEEKIKWEVKLECEQIPKKCRHFRNSTSSKNLTHRKSRSKDYDVYSDNDVYNQEPEDNFAKELQQYMQAKEMANAAQSLPFPEESMKKEGVKDTQKGEGQIILSFQVYLKIMVFLDLYPRLELAWAETTCHNLGT